MYALCPLGYNSNKLCLCPQAIHSNGLGQNVCNQEIPVGHVLIFKGFTNADLEYEIMNPWMLQKIIMLRIQYLWTDDK